MTIDNILNNENPEIKIHVNKFSELLKTYHDTHDVEFTLDGEEVTINLYN